MSKIRNTAVAAMVGAALMAPGFAEADCKLLQLAEFHVDPKSTSPIVEGSINGTPVKVLLDSGASFSMISYYQAKKLGLRLSSPTGDRAYGIGGSTQIYTADIDHFTVGNLKKDAFVATVAGDQDRTDGIAMVLGDDVLANADIEFDLAHDAIRLFKPKGCTAPQLIYWGAAYSQATLFPWNHFFPAIQTRAFLNGREVLAELDSGSEVTLIDTSAAVAAGVVRAAGDTPDSIIGSGPKKEPSWLGRFDSFALGDEKIGHVNVRISPVNQDMTYTETGSNMVRHVEGPAMLIGDDFLRAHRVFVDNEDHLILFSYQGGPVFDTASATAVTPTTK